MVIKNHIPIYHIIKINVYAYKWQLQQFHRFNENKYEIRKSADFQTSKYLCITLFLQPIIFLQHN